MNLYELRQEVRRLLRDDTYPREDVDAAINRVLADVNVSGRYQFHETQTDLTLVSGTYKYAVASDIIAEHLLVYKPESADEVPLDKIQRGLEDAMDADYFSATGIPTAYLRWGGYWWLDPIPNATAAGQTVRIYGHEDLAKLSNDTDTPGLPSRYHNVLTYGAAAQINPMIKSESSKGALLITALFSQALNNMRLQENWKPLRIPQLIRGRRFAEQNEWGHVSTLR